VQLTDVTSDTATFSLIGPESDALLDQLGAGAITGQPSTHQLVQMGSCEVRVAVGSGLAIPGYPSPQLKTRLRFGAVLSKLGQYHWASVSGNCENRTRTPSPDQELSDDYNPLEAGLWQTISFGAAILSGNHRPFKHTRSKAISVGRPLSAPVEPGSVITVGDDGKLTSYTETDRGCFGLATFSTKAGGLKVQVGENYGKSLMCHFNSQPSIKRWKLREMTRETFNPTNVGGT